ncbi:MAG: DNA repair protein RadC, partial [Gammaproteobacteria bacterium]|nr:DNA repair protein RadC [Gammaproteobacteria bacterium]
MPTQHSLSFNTDRFSEFCAKDLSTTEADAVVQLALHVLEIRHQPGQSLDSPNDSKAYLRIFLRDHKAEVFGVLFLDNRHQIITNEILFHGTIDGASVHPRIVVQRALECNAAAVVIYHNHPAQVAEPS